MPVTAALTRRQVLTLVGGSVLAVTLGGCSADREPATFWTLLAEAAHRDHPGLDADLAERELGRAVTADRAQRPSAALRADLVARIGDDFAAGRTVLVAGWLLARTEVLLAVLVEADR